MKVWIDQDLCTGDGLCEEIAPAVFTLLDDGLAYVKEGDKVFSDPGGAEGPGRSGGTVLLVGGGRQPSVRRLGQSTSMKMHSPGHSSADSMVASSMPAGTLASPSAPPGSLKTLSPSFT